MCYPLPGPRCSASAAADLQRVRVAHDLNPFSLDVNEAVEQAQLAYDATPAGQHELVRRIEQEQDRSYGSTKQLTEYQLRLDLGRAKRAEALAALKMKDRGDIAHSQQQTEVVFPPEFHHLRTEPYTGASEKEAELLQKQPAMVDLLISDSHAGTEKFTAAEIESLSFYTSNGSFVVNKTLTGTQDGLFAGDNHRAAAAIENLDSALAKSERATPLRVYRGISREVLAAQGYDDDMPRYVADNFTVGETWSSPVFQSSTLDYRKARGFARSGLVLEILAKHAAPVSNISAWGWGESEQVLPRNQAYRVVNVQHYVKTLPNPRGDDYTYDECVVQLVEV